MPLAIAALVPSTDISLWSASLQSRLLRSIQPTEAAASRLLLRVPDAALRWYGPFAAWASAAWRLQQRNPISGHSVTRHWLFRVSASLKQPQGTCLQVTHAICDMHVKLSTSTSTATTISDAWDLVASKYCDEIWSCVVMRDCPPWRRDPAGTSLNRIVGDENTCTCIAQNLEGDR